MFWAPTDYATMGPVQLVTELRPGIDSYSRSLHKGAGWFGARIHSKLNTKVEAPGVEPSRCKAKSAGMARSCKQRREITPAPRSVLFRPIPPFVGQSAKIWRYQFASAVGRKAP
jgi:hypothetical protein